MKTVVFCIIYLFTLFNVSNIVGQPGKVAAGINSWDNFHDNLFNSEKILDITISGDIKELLKDRDDPSSYHSLLLTYLTEDKSYDTLDPKIRTRGHFRRMRRNCKYPPLLLNFSESNIPPSSPFYGQDKLKLVTPCRGDKYVVREYLVYKIYNLVTEKSFRDRLVRIVFNDSKKNKPTSPMFGLILEEENRMAGRNHSISIEKENVVPVATRREEFLKMATFEFLIGNTDWSVRYLQNIKLLYTDTAAVPVTVPYDFDHAGIVNAPYARPAPELKMNSVRERRYRGFCIQDIDLYKNTFELYNRLKPDIYRIYTDCKLIDDKYKQTTIKYLDEFYSIINDPKSSRQAFTYPCNPVGTGNIIIKGLRK